MERIGIVGGTGPLGRGLAARWARQGHRVHIGSRDRQRAEDAVERLVDEGAPPEQLAAGANEEVVPAVDVVILAVPYAAQQATLAVLADLVADRIVCTAVVPLGFDGDGPYLESVAAGSAAAECREILPEARLVAGFHAVSSKRLRRVDEPVDADALLCGDDEEALEVVARLADEIPGLRGVIVGPLRLAAQLEGQTAVVLSYNRRAKTEAGLRLVES
jgi:8-hydroxy-5-deazaflavin:NADPH oxidoreductase